MGKSRMIDELSKKHLVLPINLRPTSDTGLYLLFDLSSRSSLNLYALGFPAADVDVRTFLTVDETEKNNILRRSHAFLFALFTTVKVYLQNIDQHISQHVYGLPPEQYPQTIAQKFRLLMTAGQTFNKQGDKRREFYSAVVRAANEVLVISWMSSFLVLTYSIPPASARGEKCRVTGIQVHPAGYASPRNH
jgi:hypothetical protein